MTSVQTTFKISCLTSFKCSVLMRGFFEVLPGPPYKERHETSIRRKCNSSGWFLFFCFFLFLKKKKKRKKKDKGKRNNGWLLATKTVRRCVLTAHGLFIGQRPQEAQDTSRPSQHHLLLFFFFFFFCISYLLTYIYIFIYFLHLEDITIPIVPI